MFIVTFSAAAIGLFALDVLGTGLARAWTSGADATSAENLVLPPGRGSSLGERSARFWHSLFSLPYTTSR